MLFACLFNKFECMHGCVDLCACWFFLCWVTIWGCIILTQSPIEGLQILSHTLIIFYICTKPEFSCKFHGSSSFIYCFLGDQHQILCILYEKHQITNCFA
jgi:hypothetical protein